MNWKEFKHKSNLKQKDFLKQFVLWKNRLRINFFFIKIEKKEFKLVVNERFEKVIKNLSRVILLLNVILVFVFLPNPSNIIISLILITIEQIVERTVFSFESASIVPPIPSLELWHKADFRAVLIGGHKYRKEPGSIEMYFGNEEAAKEVFKYVKSWNFDNNQDLGTESHIRITFVINRKKDKYAIFVSPSVPSKTMDQLRLQKMDKIKKGKEPWIFMQALMMCKLFNFKNSGLEMFLQIYKPNYEYDFAFYSGNPQMPQIVNGTSPIRKDKLNIINFEDLTQKDIEMFMCKYNIDWDDNTPVPKSNFWYST